MRSIIWRNNAINAPLFGLCATFNGFKFLPAGVEQASVGQRPGSVVVLDVEGNGADVSTVAITAVEVGHGGEPAVHPPVAAAADEDDLVVR